MDQMTSVSKSRPPPRLMITRMILENFKSYAGIQEIGPFHKRFSSIVGPNGSGKSNVIDALLFVFAKRASQLRLKKVSELIHKSSNYPNLGYAQVSVYFQMIYDDDESEDEFEVVPNSEFVISRIADRDNQSKYLINNKASTSTDVKNLLDTYGIDLENNRFLILQGEVEQIAMMKPKAPGPKDTGLLEYLEEIIGSDRFVEPIEEASKVLDSINEKRVERVNRLKQAEKERDNLNGSKTEAETYLELEKEIRKRENILYQVYEHNIRSKQMKCEQELAVLNEKLIAEQAQQNDHIEALNKSETEYKSAKKQYDKIVEVLNKANMDFASFERRDVKLQEDMKHVTEQLKKAKTNSSKELKKENDSLKTAEANETQIQNLQKSIEDIQSKKLEEEAKIEEVMGGMQEATKSLREKLEGAQMRLAEAERNTAGLQSEKEILEQQVQLVKSRSEKAKAAVTSFEAKLKKLSDDRKESDERYLRLQQDLIDAEKQLQSLEKVRVKLQETEASLQTDIRSSLLDVEEAKAKLAAQKSSTGSSTVVAAIMKASQSKGPLASAGVHGRLGDLGMIDDEFDVAVSTACGMLDYIVVETTEGAQACLNYLRDNNIGRASFLLMDQIQEWKKHMASPFRTPSQTHRLFDLIQPFKEEYLPAFYMALKDTLVANDLESATSIAYVGDRAVHRVVTRSGELIDTSGAMSGGGKDVRSGSMKLKSSRVLSRSDPSLSHKNDSEVTEKGINELESKLQSLQSQLNKCRLDLTENENQIKLLKEKSKSIDSETNRLKLALGSFGDQEKDLLHRLDQSQHETSLSPHEQSNLSEIESKILLVDREIQLKSPDLKTIKREVMTLQQQIGDVCGPKLSKAQARLTILSTQLDEKTKELTSLQVEQTNARKTALKSQSLREKAEKDAAEYESKLSQYQKDQIEMENEALQVISAVETIKKEMLEKEEKLESFESQFKQIKSELSKRKSLEEELHHEISKLKEETHQLIVEAKKHHEKLDELRKKHVQEQMELKESMTAAIQSVISSTTAMAMANNDSILSNATASLLIDSMAINEEIEQLPVISNYEEIHIDDVKKNIVNLEETKRKLEAAVNMEALIDYMKKDAQYKVRVAELEAITEERNRIRSQYEDLRRQRLEAFMGGFSIISLKLKEMYQMITLGGDAELELVDSLDPFSEGIVFTVRPKNKSWKNISNLSGGEKTLSSLALVFALHHYKPTPLYVMDEIDAALDFKNVSIVANYIKDRTKNAQFVIISLRNNMFELADRLVGIYKTHDATKSVTINPKAISKEAMIVSEASDEAVENNQIESSEGVGKTLNRTSSQTRKVLADATNTK